MTMRTTRTLAAALGLIWAAGAEAHEARVRHGGRLAEAGAFHLEMVARGQTVDVFVSDARGRPVPAAGFSGVAILVVDGRAARIPLAPAGDDRLTGTASAALGAAPRGAVQITGPGGATASGSFN